MVTHSIIITAGGIGKRMGSEIPKQFIEICGKPILLHTLELFYHFDSSMELFITLPEDWKSYWNEILENHTCTIPHQLISGGEERYHSIQNALQYCSGKYISVHDGVRPLVSASTLKNCFEALENHEAVVPVLGIKESIRQVEKGISHAVNRNEFKLIQTPQCFHASVLNEAYQQAFHERITDDASLVEEKGLAIHLVEGNEENIKITTPNDLRIAELFIQDKSI
jgi:2-C-methyl-D-erythritol 4-phosphate cytidylyltransferase